MADTKNTKFDPDLSWQAATNLIKSKFHFSSSFTTTIRALKNNELENLKEGKGNKHLNAVGRYNAMRLFKASSIKAPLYYLTLTFKSEEIEGKEHVKVEDLISLYTVQELSAVLALAYIFNALRKLCDPEEWQKQAKFINDSVDIGAFLSRSMPEITFADGILLVGVRAIASSLYLAKDLKIFKNYRRDMKIKKVTYDTQMEYELFGCTHIDIATQILQGLGFGVDLSTDFYKSLFTLPHKPLETRPSLMRILLLWVEALHMGKKPPAIHGENEVNITEDKLDRLIMLSKQIHETGSTFNWLSKGKSSITKEVAPILYGKTKAKQEEELEEEEAERQLSV